MCKMKVELTEPQAEQVRAVLQRVRTRLLEHPVFFDASNVSQLPRVDGTTLVIPPGEIPLAHRVIVVAEFYHVLTEQGGVYRFGNGNARRAARNAAERIFTQWQTYESQQRG